MTSQIDIDCRHYYGDRELGTARPVDINDHQESTERHRQQAVHQTTETPQRLKRVLYRVHTSTLMKPNRTEPTRAREPSRPPFTLCVANRRQPSNWVCLLRLVLCVASSFNHSRYLDSIMDYICEASFANTSLFPSIYYPHTTTESDRSCHPLTTPSSDLQIMR